MKKTTSVLSFRATTELVGKIKAYAVLNDLTISEAIIDLVKKGLNK